MSPTCLAVMCVRNEAAHMARAIGDFVSQGIDVIVIDHGSTDGTVEVCRQFLGRGLLRIDALQWRGEYDQTAQLQAKRSVIEHSRHDWVIHADADEWMHTQRPGETLLQGLQRLDEAGYNAVNFEEFVFLPQEEDPPAADCKRELLDYYFFAPQPRRLMRAWRREQGFSNLDAGGHALTGGDLRLADEQFVLRHYIVLSQAHAIEKYASRVFAQGDLAKGWHFNRLNLTAERLRLPSASRLKSLRRWDDVHFDRSQPLAKHYWQWDPLPAAASARQPVRLLACVYTCEAHRELLARFYATPVGRWLLESPDTQVLEVYADDDLRQSVLQGRELRLAVREQYERLSIKTHAMLEFCVRHFDFDTLLKIDVTTALTDLDAPQYAGRRPIDPQALLDAVRNADRSSDYAGLLLHRGAAREGAEGWASKKGGKIDYARLFGDGPMPAFYSGKCYLLSQRFARYAAERGGEMAREHAQHFMGAEDLMIGRLHERFRQEVATGEPGAGPGETLSFIHIPKNAGTSIKQAIEEAGLPIPIASHWYERRLASAEFVVLRSPTERFASALHYGRKLWPNPANQAFETANELAEAAADAAHPLHALAWCELGNRRQDFLLRNGREVPQHRVQGRLLDLNFVYEPQASWLIHRPRHVVRYGHLQEDLDRVLLAHGLPTLRLPALNRSDRPADRYSDKALAFLHTLYAQDFDYLREHKLEPTA